jgi:hypothetical protein
MNEFVQYFTAFAGACVVGYLGVLFVKKARAQNRSNFTDEDDDVFINIALCETRTGVRTHYHDIGTGALNYGGYPVGKDHPTLCGAETGWDMKNQDVDATCETCVEALAKYAREFDAA